MITRQFLQTTPHAPGVYLMIGKRSEVLYVGKAKDLHKRLSSYAPR
jgi:excinuclease ABC subunit C